MENEFDGTLFFKGEGKKRKLYLKFTTRNDKTWENPIGENILSAALKEFAKEEKEQTEKAVKLQEKGGRPIAVYLEGETVINQAKTVPVDYGKKSSVPSSGKSGFSKPKYFESGKSKGESVDMPRDFHNPYNFVPAIPRDDVNKLKDANGEIHDLGDKPPIGHDRFYPKHLSGKLTVKMTVETPLVVLDTARMTYESTNKHKSYPVRIENGKPFINPTAVKGMLRSAYEAVTNSRLSVFTKHEDRLAYRMDSTEGARIVPVRIEGEEGKENIVFYTGTSRLKTANDKDGEPQNGNPLCAAWIETYNAGSCELHNNRIKLKDVNRVPSNGEKVFAWIEKLSDGRNRFKFWNVGEMALDEASLRDAPPVNGNEHKKVFGFVCITGKNAGNGALSNMGNKHDERLFFNFYDGAVQPLYDSVELTDNLRKSWNGLIKNYKIDKNEDNRPKVKKGGIDIKLQWSRHIRETHESEIQQNTELKAEKLKDGTLCYARVQWNGKTFDVIELYPVIISRRLHEVSPADLLDENLKPASIIENVKNEDGTIKYKSEMSPADRVFGFVRHKRKDKAGKDMPFRGKIAGYRGQVRFGSVKCNGLLEKDTNGKLCLNKDGETIQGFNNLPLNILGQPKPQQGRFYVAKDNQGNAQERSSDLTNEKAGYKEGKGLRGRKVYPHHSSLPTDYWQNPMDATLITTNPKFFKEYRCPPKAGQEQRDSQNRSIQGWIKPLTEFEFDLHFTNLSEVELGALVWLLQLPPEHFHRFGGGKPLGFGSVSLSLKNSEIANCDELKEFYKSLDATLTTKTTTPENYKAEFEKVANQDILSSFKVACKGFTTTGLPIHYPRARRYKQERGGPEIWLGSNNETLTTKPIIVPPHSEGLAYEWFVANNKTGKQIVLPNISEDKGLPILDHKKTGG